VRCNSTSGNVQNQPILSSQNLINTTVILPSGIHSLPNKGGPSSLLQRWRSGGSCDCGGWDLGCKLRILVNQNPINKSSPSKACSAIDKFELVSQVYSLFYCLDQLIVPHSCNCQLTSLSRNQNLSTV
jgi:hypothetical protein